MASSVSNQCHRQVSLCPGGRRSVSICGGRSLSVTLLRLPRVAPINATLTLSASTKQSHNPDLSPIPPLCLLVQNGDQNQTLDLQERYPYCFVSISDNKIFKPSQIRHPWDDEFFFPNDSEFRGTSSLGWVLMKNPRTDQMFLINPLSPSDTAVPLPPIYTLEPTFVGGSVTKSPFGPSRLSTEYITFEEVSEEDSDSEMKKLVLRHCSYQKLCLNTAFAMSDPPSDPNCTILMQNGGILGFWKPGHKCWTLVNEPNTCYDGQNIVYSKAHQCFYVLDTDEYFGGKANVDGWKWDTEYNRPPERTSHFELTSPRPSPKGDIECKRYAHWCEKLNRQYLVESASGDLLLVEMHSKEDANEKDVTFFVFRLNLKLRKWELVNSLGSSSLLVGKHYALWVEADDYPELKPNCIYLDTGAVFKMDDASMDPNYFKCDHRGPSIWVFPNPNS